MNNKKLLFGILLLTIIAQLGISGSMIFQFEDIMNTGKEYKFRTAPIDPNDPFRGKYVSLSYLDNIVRVSLPDFEKLYGQKVYAIVENDQDGFAKIKSIAFKSTDLQRDYFQSNIMGVDSHQIVLNFPFDKFYMEESKAPQAEIIYNQAVIDTNQVTYALVKIKNGKAIIKDIYINDTSILQLIKSKNK